MNDKQDKIIRIKTMEAAFYPDRTIILTEGGESWRIETTQPNGDPLTQEAFEQFIWPRNHGGITKQSLRSKRN